MENIFAFTPADWCWQLADGRVWCTAKTAFIAQEDSAAWCKKMGLPAVPQSPVDEAGEHSVAGLHAALIGYGLPLGELATTEDLQASFTAAIQKRLDDFAKTRNYDNIMSVATYATSTNPRFAAEGQYAVEARDATWAKGYEILGDVMSGKRPMPSWEEVEAELPPLAWPEV